MRMMKCVRCESISSVAGGSVLEYGFLCRGCLGKAREASRGHFDTLFGDKRKGYPSRPKGGVSAGSILDMEDDIPW